MNSEWVTTKLGEVCDMYQPKTISSKQMIPEGQYPVYGANGIIGRFNKFNHNEPQVLLTCRGATCGAVNVSLPNSWINGNAMVVKAIDNSMDQRFLEYALKGGIDLSNAITGAAQPQITRQSLSQVKISYPKSLTEQRRIVAILDEAFAAIDKAKANTEQNLRNARELFESYLQGVFEKRSNNWDKKLLSQVCKFRNGAAHEQHIDDNGKYILINSKFISTDGKKFKRTNSLLAPLSVNDIAFVMSDVPNGKALGKCFLVRDNGIYTLNQRIGAIQSEVLIPEFLVYQLNRNKHFLSFDNGENQTNLRKDDILKCPLWLPPRDEQQAIVFQLDKLRFETQKLELLYTKKLEDLEELKKSVLQKAFSGEIQIPIEVA